MMKTSKYKVLKSTFPDITDWNAIKWHKIEKYVDKLQKRIYHAESIGNFRK
jgi:RNA-directed DNA polymerase